MFSSKEIDSISHANVSPTINCENSGNNQYKNYGDKKTSQKTTPTHKDTRKWISTLFPKIVPKSKKMTRSSSVKNTVKSEQDKKVKKRPRRYSSPTSKPTNSWKETNLSEENKKKLNEGIDAEKKLEELIEIIHFKTKNQKGYQKNRNSNLRYSI